MTKLLTSGALIASIGIVGLASYHPSKNHTKLCDKSQFSASIQDPLDSQLLATLVQDDTDAQEQKSKTDEKLKKATELKQIWRSGDSASLNLNVSGLSKEDQKALQADLDKWSKELQEKIQAKYGSKGAKVNINSWGGQVIFPQQLDVLGKELKFMIPNMKENFKGFDKFKAFDSDELLKKFKEDKLGQWKIDGKSKKWADMTPAEKKKLEDALKNAKQAMEKAQKALEEAMKNGKFGDGKDFDFNFELPEIDMQWDDDNSDDIPPVKKPTPRSTSSI